MRGYLGRHITETAIYATVFLLQCIAAAVWLRSRTPRPRPAQKRAAALFVLGSMFLLGFSYATASGRVALIFPARLLAIIRMVGTSYGVISIATIVALAALRIIPRPAAAVSPGRRRFLQAARTAIVVAPAAVIGYGVFIERRDMRLVEVDLPVSGLPVDLQGLRLVQLTDIHLSPYLSRADLRRAVDIANGTRAHIALVTGDLITTASDPLYSCIDELKRLRADAGIVGCHGNHEIYARCQKEATEAGARAGIQFLRRQTRDFRFGSATLNIAGVDYQRFHEPYLVGAQSLVRPGQVNVLLSHNPDVFPVATDQGFHVTISGHTHGGQITAEILDSNISVARFYTPFVYGVYRRGSASQYVGRGIGTVGFPARIGAPPEVALLRLCAT